MAEKKTICRNCETEIEKVESENEETVYGLCGECKFLKDNPGKPRPVAE